MLTRVIEVVDLLHRFNSHLNSVLSKQGKISVVLKVICLISRIISPARRYTTVQNYELDERPKNELAVSFNVSSQ